MADKNNIHLAQPVNYGLSSNRIVTYFNLLEEIDMPGEWYLDRSSSTLYFYPPSEIRDVQLSLLEEPLIKIEGGSDVTLDGLTLEATCGHGVQVIGGIRNTIANCTIRNVGVSGGGTDHVVENCEIYGVGYGGVCSRRKPSHVGAGQHCCSQQPHPSCQRWMRTIPAQSIPGVMYRCLGNVIRYNFMHDIGKKGNPHNVFAIYLDDKTCGTLVSDNIFVRTGNCGLKLSGGYMNTIENNIFVDVPAIFIFNDYGRKAFLGFVNTSDEAHGLRRKLEYVNHLQAPYTDC